VVEDYRRNHSSQTGSSGDQGLGNARRNCAQGSRASGAQAVKRVNDSPDRSEKSDEGRDCPRGGQPGKLALQAAELLRTGNLHGALDRVQAADPTARIAQLPAIFIVSAFKDGNERTGRILMGRRRHIGQPHGLAEGADKAAALPASTVEAAPFGENDGPTEKAEDEQNNEDSFGDRTALQNKICDLATGEKREEIDLQHLDKGRSGLVQP